MKVINRKDFVNESTSSVTSEFSLEGMSNAQDFDQLINGFRQDQYEFLDYKIKFDHDHSDYVEPAYFNDYVAFINKLNEDYKLVSSVEMKCIKEEDAGMMIVDVPEQKVRLFMPQKKTLTR